MEREAPPPDLPRRRRRASDAELCWVPPLKPHPYEQADIDAASAEMVTLEGHSVTSEELLAQDVAVTETPVAVLRRSDFVGLFDTAPDLSGADLDIAPYVRDADDLDAQVAWATWGPEAEDGRPSADAKAPRRARTSWSHGRTVG